MGAYKKGQLPLSKFQILLSFQLKILKNSSDLKLLNTKTKKKLKEGWKGCIPIYPSPTSPSPTPIKSMFYILPPPPLLHFCIVFYVDMFKNYFAHEIQRKFIIYFLFIFTIKRKEKKNSIISVQKPSLILDFVLQAPMDKLSVKC